MENKLELAQDRLMDKIGNICDRFGLNQFVAQLYVVLYLSDKPLSLDDLTVRLKASKGNVSINIRELERWGAVRRIWVKGSRRDFYEAEPDIKKVIVNKLKLAAKTHMSEISAMIDEFDSTLNSAESGFNIREKETARFYRQRIKKVQELNDFMSNAMKIAEKLF